MATLKDLHRRMNRIADNIDDAVKEVRDDTAAYLVEELIDRTPVDTSKALSNWRVTVGAIMPDIPALTVGSRGSTRAASAASALAAAQAAIRAADPKAVLVIFNSVKYIRALNGGSSSQAPAGFVEAAHLLARMFAKTRRLNLDSSIGRGSLNE